MMRRREFIGLLGGAVVAPLVAHAEDRVRRVGVLMPTGAKDTDQQASLAAFRHALQDLGWIDGPQRAVRYPLGRGQSQ
jgi:putative tryptophan/tyrosine transport system substrate-binding protein